MYPSTVYCTQVQILDDLNYILLNTALHQKSILYFLFHYIYLAALVRGNFILTLKSFDHPINDAQ